MPWFAREGLLARTGFGKARARVSRDITRHHYLRFDQLEDRRLFSANAWLPRAPHPLDGVNQYTQQFQVFQTSLGSLMPDLGLSGGTVTAGGNFSLTDTGSYSVSYSEAGPFDSGHSFSFTESGTITFSLSEQGSLTLGGFSVTSDALTQTASLGWTFVETDSAGNTVQSLTGTSTFTLQGTPSAPFDPLFWQGFDWHDPTWQISSQNALNLPGLTASALTVSETNGSESYTLQIAGAPETLTGSGSQPLYDRIEQSGGQTFTVTVTESVSLTNQGSDTFTLNEAGSYSGGSFALSSVTYSEKGTDTVPVTEAGTYTGGGTEAASGQQNAAGHLHTLADSTQETFQFSDLNTLSYGETAADNYTLSLSGSYAAGSFNLGNLSYSDSGSGTLALTLVRGSTHTGTMAGTSSSGSTDTFGVAGTLTDTGTATQSAPFTQTETDTVSGGQSGTFSLTELGGYANGSWGLGTVILNQSFGHLFRGGRGHPDREGHGDRDRRRRRHRQLRPRRRLRQHHQRHRHQQLRRHPDRELYLHRDRHLHRHRHGH